MALSDNETEKARRRNKSRAIDAGTNLRWSDKQKLEAVSSYLALGNLSMTARVLGIPEITLRVWKASTWWKELVDELRMQDKIVLSHRMKSLAEAAQIIVANRLENGDAVLNQKTGEIVYKPVSMKDAHKVAVDLIDRQDKLEKITSGEAPTDQQNDDKLEKLAVRFAEIATKHVEKQFDKSRTLEDVSVQDVSFREGEQSLSDEENQQISNSELSGEDLQELRASEDEGTSAKES